MLPLLKIILKTRDEDFLIEAWIQYYIKLVGAENIIIYDDNSISEKVLEVYKKYSFLDIRKLPKNVHSVENLHRYEDLKQELKKSCQYWAFFDTDEFLCYFDSIQNCINNTQLMNYLHNNSTRNAFTTIWVPNLYDGVDFTSINDVTRFKFNLNSWHYLFGKTIISSSAIERLNGTAWHNSCLGSKKLDSIPIDREDLTFTGNLLLLHLQDVNWPIRIQTKVSFLKHTNKMVFTSIEDLVYQISKLEKKQHHALGPVFDYYTDKDKFLAKRRNINLNAPTLVTNIISSTIEDKETYSKFLNPHKDVIGFFKKIFVEAFSRYKNLNIILDE